MYWSLKDKKGLVIDDFAEVRSTIKSVLKSLECENVKLAKDAKEALALMHYNYFDFILCDYNLGDEKDGQQILEEAKYLDILPYSTVFMMITAENTSKMVMGALDWAPDDYVQKPITKAVLSARLKKVLERKQGLKQIAKHMMGEKKDYAKALDLCVEKMTEEKSQSFELLKLKIDILIKLERYQDAIEECQAFFKLREVGTIGLLLTKALLLAGRFEEAEKVINKVIASNDKYILAYDLLAKIKVSQGEFADAQAILESATKQSPKALIRQRSLAEIAFKNESFAVAEKAYKQAINQGKHSCFGTYLDYIGRAQSLFKNNQSADALGVIRDIKKEFKRDPAILLHASTLESRLYKDMEKNELSSNAANSAYELFQRNPEEISSEVAIDLAKVCMSLNKKDQANKLMEQALQNNPDDKALQEEVKKARASVEWLKNQMN